MVKGENLAYLGINADLCTSQKIKYKLAYEAF